MGKNLQEFTETKATTSKNTKINEVLQPLRVGSASIQEPINMLVSTTHVLQNKTVNERLAHRLSNVLKSFTNLGMCSQGFNLCVQVER